MNRNTMIAAGTALLLAFFTNNSQGQNAAPASAPTLAPAQPLAPNQPLPAMRQMPRPIPPPRSVVSRTLLDLRQMKAMLEASKEDFGGHKASALEAVEKARLECEAVMKAMPAPQQPMRRTFQPPGAAPGAPGAPAPAAPPTAPPPATILPTPPPQH